MISIKKTIYAIAFIIPMSFLTLSGCGKAKEQAEDLTFYKPQEFEDTDFNDPSSRFSFARSRESEHFILFWEAGFGDDPNSDTLPEGMRVDTDDLLNKVEQFYTTETTRLGFGKADGQKSYLDTYKMEIYLYYQDEWLATGSGYDDVIGALWVSPSTCQPVGAVIAHEIGHSFQYQIACDEALNGDSGQSGFRYAYNEGYGNTFWEQCAEWQAWQDYPEEAFTWYYEDQWKSNSHRSFENEWSRYQSYWLQFALAEKFGEDAVGRIWQEAMYPEDSLDAVKRIFFDGDTEKYNDFLYYYASHTATYDYEALADVTEGRWDTDYDTTLYPVSDGWSVISYADCPDDGGFNVLNLNASDYDGTVTVDFKTLPIGSPLATADPGEIKSGEEGTDILSTTRTFNQCSESTSIDPGHHYGFVALLTDGSRVYSDSCLAQEGTLSFSIPENTESLYFVVAGTPSEHLKHTWDNDESTDLQLPYEIKIY